MNPKVEAKILYFLATILVWYRKQRRKWCGLKARIKAWWWFRKHPAPTKPIKEPIWETIDRDYKASLKKQGITPNTFSRIWFEQALPVERQTPEYWAAKKQYDETKKLLAAKAKGRVEAQTQEMDRLLDEANKED